MNVWHERFGWTEYVGAAFLGSYGIFVVTLACRDHKHLPHEFAVKWLTVGLPVCMSFDNFVMGAGAPISGTWIVPAAAGAGLMSGGLSWLGWNIGEALRHRSPARLSWNCALPLLVAFSLMLKDNLLELVRGG
jgi:putative Mn2+ efflux pump MntP